MSHEKRNSEHWTTYSSTAGAMVLNQDLHLVSLKTETVAPPTGHYIPKLTKNK